MGRGQIVNFLNIEIKQQVKKVTDTVSGIYILNSLGNAVTGMEFVTEINAVSYTHLDVYKRQQLDLL